MVKEAETSKVLKIVTNSSQILDKHPNNRAVKLLTPPEKAIDQPIATRMSSKQGTTFEAFLNHLSLLFIELPASQVDSQIEKVQQQICEYLHLDVCSLWQLSADQPESLVLTHIYHPPDFPPLPERMFAREHFPWVMDQLLKGERIVLSQVSDAPAEAVRDLEQWRYFGLKSILNFPLSTGGGPVFGVLNFDCLRKKRTWSIELVNKLQLVAQIFANALDRKRENALLQKSEERLALAADAAGLVIWALDVTTEELWTTGKLREVFELQPGVEMDFTLFMSLVHPDDRESIHRAIEQAWVTDDLTRVDYRIVRPDNNIRWIISRARTQYDTSMGKKILTGVSMDVTERKQTELQLQSSQTLLNSLINSTPDMIWSVDAEHFGLLTFNSGLCEYFMQGSGIHLKVGMRPEDLLPTEAHAKQWRQFYRRALKEGTFTTEYRTSTGERTLRLNLNTLKSDDKVFGISVFGQNITALQEMGNQLREQLAEIERLKSQLEKENLCLRDEIKLERGFGKIIGHSDAIQYVLFRAQQVAPTDATVLILGETGAGKGMVANAIHEMSGRKDKPMLVVNCAALPGNLIESELFGREKGAFTGAHARQEGRFEVADGGTIFLDEIGELVPELQSKLLRVLQDGEFERLGSSRTIKVNVRVIASTSRDLKAEMRNGRFREDLYYRLNVFPVSLPPLRTRGDDIPELAEYFIGKYAQKFGKRFATVANDTMPMLQSYHWPGNVRELEHIIERAVITSIEPVFQLAEQFELEPAKVAEGSPKEFEAIAREHILQVLQNKGWKIEGEGGAAAALGLNPSTLRFRIRKLGIKRP
jgi:formate hydrogenlyase transcriptional activator